MKIPRNNPAEFLTEKELARMMRVSVRTLQRLRTQGVPAFPCCRIGQRTLYARESVLRRFLGNNSGE